MAAAEESEHSLILDLKEDSSLQQSIESLGMKGFDSSSFTSLEQSGLRLDIEFLSETGCREFEDSTKLAPSSDLPTKVMESDAGETKLKQTAALANGMYMNHQC